MPLRLRFISYNQWVDWDLGSVHTERKRKGQRNFSLSIPLLLCVNGPLVLLSQSHGVNGSIYVTAVSLDDNTHFHPIQEVYVDFRRLGQRQCLINQHNLYP